MPGNVANAAPSLVLPNALCTAYSQAREWAVDWNPYKSAECQARARTTTSRKTWQQTRKLTPSALVTLRNFYDSVNGPVTPFYFYDTRDDQTAVYDATGVLTAGRYTVRFEGKWQQTMNLSRGDAGLALVELA